MSRRRPPLPGTVTRRDIARCMRLHRSTVLRRSQREGWPYVARPRPRGGGNPVHHYWTDRLPSDIRQALRDGAPPPGRPARAKCSRPGCGRDAESKGLCNGHWQRLRDGRPLDDPPLEDMRPAPDPAMVRRGIEALRASDASVSSWARERGWDPTIVWRLASGHLAGRKGKARAVALELERIGREGRLQSPEASPIGEPPAMSTRTLKGHPSRYALLKRPRLPDWVREEMSL